MPQIAQIAETYSSQIFWLLVFFGIVFFVVGRGMVPKVMGTVAQRDGQIASDLAAAEAARAQADEEEEAWRKRENENRAAAQALVAKAKAAAAVSSETKLAAAIAAARTSALAEIEDVAADAARDIVRRLAGVSVTAATAKKAVKEAMQHG